MPSSPPAEVATAPVAPRLKLGRAASASVVLKAANAGLAFLTTVALARLLGVQQLGHYSFAIAVAGLASIPTQFGVQTLLVREIAASRARGQTAETRQLLAWSDRFILKMSAALLLAALVVVLVWEGALSTSALTLGLALLAVPCLSLGRARGASVRGLGHVVTGQFAEVLQPFATLVLIGILVVVWGPAFGASTALLGHLGASLVTFVVGSAMLRHFLGPSPDRQAAPASALRRAWRRSLLPLGALSASHFVIQYTDVVMLGLLGDVDDVGVYRATAQVSMLVGLGLRSVNSVMGPQLSRHHALGEPRAIERTARRAARGVLAIALPTALGLWAWGDWLLGRVFGPEFVAGYAALALLTGGHLVSAAVGSPGLVLNMCRLEGLNARVLALRATLNLVLNAILIPPLGVVGAACATTASLMVRNAVLLAMVHRRLGISTAAFSLPGRS